jgi:septal ring factor EnvC (AmiA/AmiB activator)
LLEKELAPTIKTLTRHGRAVEKITALEEEKGRRLDGVLTALVSLVEQLNGEVQKIPQSANGLVGLSAGLEKAQREVEGLTAAMSSARAELTAEANETTQTLQRVVAERAVSLEAARVNREALEKELEKSRDTVAKVHETLLSLVSVTIERLGNSGPRTDKSDL